MSVQLFEIDSEGEVLEWRGDLLNIAQELLIEFEHPDTSKILNKLANVERYWPVSNEPVHWFVGQMNRLKNGYTYKGQVVA